jgi:hypothetical protein
MRFQEIAISTLLFGASAIAAEVEERQLNVNTLNMLLKRQSQFVPNTTTAEGTTCADAFGTGYETCAS